MAGLAVLAAALSLAACGGGGGDDAAGGGSTPPPSGGTNRAPVASAGPDQTVDAGTLVTLSAASSTDADGDTMTYAWQQTDGPAVTLGQSAGASVSFSAPSVASQTVFGFRVTVSDGRGGSHTDSVAVTVRPQVAGTPQGIGMLSALARDPAQFTAAGGKVFFTSSSTSGFQTFDQLWVTDGTSGGTALLRDFAGSSATQFVPAANGIFFSATSALWFSDGTAAGTRLVKDITTATSENFVMLGVYGGRLYFTANDGVNGRELWTSDGTANGTFMVFDLNPGSGSSDVRSPAGSLVYWNGRLYLHAGYTDARTGSFYAQLYSTDGTPGNLTNLTNNTDYAGSVLLNYDMAVLGQRLYFTWHSRTNGVELWVTDGSAAGTRMALDVAPGSAGSWPIGFEVINGELLFFAYQDGTGSHRSMYATTGTTAGTRLVADVDKGPNAESLVPMNGRLYFPGRLRGASNFTLWSTDGTSAGTREVSSAVRPDDWYLGNKMVVLGGNKLVFQGSDGVNGNEPWVSDGTAARTFMLRNINATAGRGSYTSTVGAGWVVARGSKAYFIAAPAIDDFQLWETDGTAAGTKTIAPSDATVTVNPMGQPGFSSAVPNPVPVLLGNTLIFRGSFSSAGARPYRM
jgi:ELWxxDGT repeat protein